MCFLVTGFCWAGWNTILVIIPVLFPRFLIEFFFWFVSKQAKILLYYHWELIKLQMSLMICLKQSSITTCYILTIKTKRIFKFFFKYTKEDRNSQSLISSFYKIRFEAGKLELNVYTQITQLYWKRVWKQKSNLLEEMKKGR